MAQALPESVSTGGLPQLPPPADSTATVALAPTLRKSSTSLVSDWPMPAKARRSGWVISTTALLLMLAGSCPTVAAPDNPAQGVWMVDEDVAIAVALCGAGSLCGRIAWLRAPSDGTGRPKRDERNPDAALRSRPLCGLTVLNGLVPVPDEPGRWGAGSFYDPRNGRSYGLMATLRSADVLVARVYIGMPFFGQDQTLLRVHRPGGGGWC